MFSPLSASRYGIRPTWASELEKAPILVSSTSRSYLELATKLDEINQTTVIKDMLDQAKLTKRHPQMLMQQALATEEVIKR
ncbi:hypothetical protein J1TS3_41310 [Siminovitchia fordii]|uniref:Uncharacterized protein n=1 Tax=Siminovitchia fordii TaxID=254759 RepID=A0ABQ4KD39_9BACI|nr:hypothetical protein J1TS3_41310 [Siminovitchia fordii]